MLDKAIAITAEAFLGKYDKGEKPYILHCLHVMKKVSYSRDEELMQIAILHDIVEDTKWTIVGLFEEGFSERVVLGVQTLTHKKGVSYDDYIKNIALSDDARIVKMEDLKHNSDITRMKGLRKKDFDRLEKYHRAYKYLKEI